MTKDCNVLYVASLCSNNMMNKLFETAHEKPNPAPQKYNSLLVRGLVENGVKVTCLVALPVTVRSHPNKKWWRGSNETVDGVKYVYIPFYNQPFLKLACFKLYAFFFTLLWGMRTKGDKAMLCDVLYNHASASMKACKFIGIKAVGVVTDIPGFMITRKKRGFSFFRRLRTKNRIRNIRRMTHFVPLTDAMCDIINPGRKKPYVVVEGIVDSNMESKQPVPYNDGKRHITYTGRLEARYGIKTLIEAFTKLPYDDVVLDLFGRGTMDDVIKQYEDADGRIHFHGMVPMQEAVDAQRKSFLLVNPRPTAEEFTKYSFPSKNMEYMATGVPLLTAVLPGMPTEYHPYVFLFEDESVDGLSSRLNDILSMPIAQVQMKGVNGKRFVMENKNQRYQAKKVIDLVFPSIGTIQG